jgi:hypothetical protein
MTALSRPLVFAAAWTFVCCAEAADTGLPAQSPFIAPQPAAAAASSNEPLEFAGVSTIGKKTMVNLYDKQAKKGRWIEVGASSEGITVVKYDSRRDQVMVKVNGVEKTLPLRSATAPAAGGAMAPIPPILSAPVTNLVDATGQPTAPATTPASGTDATTGATTTEAGATPGTTPPPPATVQAKQEQEARMLVSDLLEIGMAQRKAYEDAQKKAGEQNGGQPAQNSNAQPAQATPSANSSQPEAPANPSGG